MFTNKLKNARMRSGLSQKLLAEQLHISQQAYAKYETGASSPNPEMLGRIAEILNVSTDELIGLGIAHRPKTKKSIPVLGQIPAGIPIEAIEDILDYEDLSEREANDGFEYFGLRVKGNSMRSADGIILMPINTTDFEPTFYSNHQIATLPLRILGICVELRRKKTKI